MASPNPNQSLYTIPAAWVLAIAPHFYAASLGGKAFDKRSPRSYTSSLKDDQTLDAATKQRIIRAEGAQQNGFENLGLFAAAVVAANGTCVYVCVCCNVLRKLDFYYFSSSYLSSFVVSWCISW